jgi:hypothetical protein
MNDNHHGIDLLELCYKTKSWEYQVTRSNGTFQVLLAGLFAEDLDLHEAVRKAARLASGEKRMGLMPTAVKEAIEDQVPVVAGRLLDGIGVIPEANGKGGA